MSRISIDVTPEEHQRLKALAALQGKSIKEFVLASTLGTTQSADALAELEALLDERIAETRTKGVSTRTVADIFRQARREAGLTPDA
ncbi:MAG: antitoxin [Planctomycetota bacterium]